MPTHSPSQQPTSLPSGVGTASGSGSVATAIATLLRRSRPLSVVPTLITEESQFGAGTSAALQ